MEIFRRVCIPLKNDSGNPLSAGELFEIFSGLKSLPSSFDWYIEDEEASALSDALSVHFVKIRLGDHVKFR